jgi:hypothetical protein
MYTDMPAVALTMTSAALALAGWGLPAGIAFGLGFLCKKSVLFLLPMLGLFLLRGCRRPRTPADDPAAPPQPAPLSRSRRWRWAAMFVVQGALFLATAAAIYWPERQWLAANIPVQKTVTEKGYIWQRLFMIWTDEQLPSNMANPIDLLTHLGPVLIGVAGWYALRRRGRPVHRWVWVGVALGYVATVTMFSLNTDIRYALPLLPLVAIPLGGALSRLGDRRLAYLIVVACAVQFAGAGAVTMRRRRLAPETERAYANLREAIPPGSRVFHLEEAFMLHTRRAIVWMHLADPDTGAEKGPQLLFWPEPDTDARVLDVLRHNGIDYLLIKTARITPETAWARVSNVPQHFIDRLDRMERVEQVEGRWPGFELWRVTPSE